MRKHMFHSDDITILIGSRGFSPIGCSPVAVERPLPIPPATPTPFLPPLLPPCQMTLDASSGPGEDDVMCTLSTSPTLASLTD